MESVAPVSPVPPLLCALAAPLTEALKEFFARQLKLTLHLTEPLTASSALPLRGVSVLMAASGGAALVTGLSFSPALLHLVTDRFLDEISVSADERPALLRDTACEILNTVFGNCTPLLSPDGALIHLSPPVILAPETGVIRPAPGCSLSALVFATTAGTLTLILVMPLHPEPFSGLSSLVCFDKDKS